MKNVNIESKQVIDGILVSFVLFSELCFKGVSLFITPFVFFVRILFIQRKKVDESFFWLVLMMLYTSLIGIIVPQNTDNFSIFYNFFVFLNLICIYIIFSEYQTISQVLAVIKVIIVLSTLLNGLYIMRKEYSYVISRLPDYIIGHCGYRLGTNMGLNSNNIAWLFGLLALFTIYIFIEEKNWKLFLLYGFQLLILLFTGSKNGLLIAIIPLIYYGIKAAMKVDFKMLILIVVLLIVFWNVTQKIPIFYTLIGGRIDQFLYTLGIKKSFVNITVDASSTLKRMDMIKKAKQMFLEKPIFGWGIGAFAKYSGYGYYCHNNYMELLVSGGIIGFIIYYGYIGIILFRSLFYRKSAYSDLLYILILSILIIDMGTVNFYSRIPFYLRTIVLFISLAKIKKECRFYNKNIEF